MKNRGWKRVRSVGREKFMNYSLCCPAKTYTNIIITLLNIKWFLYQKKINIKWFILFVTLPFSRALYAFSILSFFYLCSRYYINDKFFIFVCNPLVPMGRRP
jgi:hypothetical protein